MTKPKISILLPTRKRTEMLVKSLNSLLATASDTSRIEVLIAYDNDDDESRDFFNDTWADYIGQCNATSKIFETERYGYMKLNRYVNFLGEQATGDWLMFWNDDALMITEGWDDRIVEQDGYFGLLRMPCVSMNHPFALFPIIPRGWIDLFGCISPVAHSDWWIYNVTVPAAAMKNIAVEVYHDRADVTGNNNDSTFQERSYNADGKDPTNPDDYSHPDRRKDLQDWVGKIDAFRRK